MYFPISVGSIARHKVTIDDDAGPSVTETQLVKAAVVAELTWAKLYTKVMHKDLGAISTAISRSKTTAAGPEMKESAEKLRGQLQSANRTVSDLSDHAGIRTVPVRR
jgi:hypothetical protein